MLQSLSRADVTGQNEDDANGRRYWQAISLRREHENRSLAVLAYPFGTSNLNCLDAFLPFLSITVNV
jgi:hypothetical protein